MNSHPLVSVIIDNYNYGRFLKDAIESVLNQTYPNVELIVVDDGSTDHSQEVIAQYSDRVTPILKENGGQASAFNAGFDASHGEIICFLDADDIMLPSRVAAAVQILLDHPEAKWCYHQLGLMDEQGKPYDTNQLDVSVTQVKPFDLRSDIQKGHLYHLPFNLPGIVGLTFWRSQLAQILPMPVADGISLNDTYVQCASCALGPGVAFPTQLEWQRIHGNNGFTQQRPSRPLNIRITLLTAHWLRINYPFITQYANNMFAIGFGRYIRYRNIDTVSAEIIQKYFSCLTPPELLNIMVRAIVNFIRG